MIPLTLLEPLAKPVLICALAAGLVFGGYLYGQHAANEKHEAAELAKWVKDINLGIAIDSADRTQREQDQNRITELQKELADARAKIKHPDDTCFDSDDVEQLLDIWPRPHGQSKPAAPAR
jgi:hypothetical protein